MAKKTKVTDTSIQAYQQITSEGLIEQEKTLVIKLLENIPRPVTSREIMNTSHKERGNITRILYDLRNESKVIISHKAKCPTTGRTVCFYKLVSNQCAI